MISVLITSFNREKFIAKAIESVLSSTFHNWELIICDDASTDKTVEIIEGYLQKDDRIKLIVNEQNIGDYANRNKVASYAKGTYLKYLDSDDLIYPWTLDVMYYCMEKNPNAAIGFSSNVNLDTLLPVELSPKDIYMLYFFKGFLLGIGPSGTIIRRKVFELLEGFSNEQFVSDTKFWLKISSTFSSVCMPPGLVFWRKHENQQIIYEKSNPVIEYKRLLIQKNALLGADCPISREISNLAYRNILNIKCRSVILDLIGGRVKQFIFRKNILKLNLYDFVLSLRKNRIPFFTTPIHDFNN